MITGKTLVEWGFLPGKWFKDGIPVLNAAKENGASDDEIFQMAQAMVPVEVSMRTNSIPYNVFLEAETDEEKANLISVNAHMDALLRVPTIVKGAIMPDACPAGSAPGTIPVGGAVATENAIHPGFHSSDICCSVAITVFKRKDDPKKLLDAVQEVTHFGPGGRPFGSAIKVRDYVNLDSMLQNRFLNDLDNFAIGHFGTQGDGNHFAFVGHLKSTGQLALVTHHGSRGLGAQLYKRGMAVAKRHTAIVAPKVPSHNAWIPADSEEGRAYWEALQFVRTWTRESHYLIHNLAAHKIGNKIEDRFWNEHNFVFRRDDGLYYHGKGATPSWSGFSPDCDGRTLIPLNMAEPILMTRHKDRKEALGFAPHGAGRNLSRTALLREKVLEIPQEIDVRFYCGKADMSELPGAYKNAESVRKQIDKFGLAEVYDEVLPYGSIMAGDWEQDAPWRKKK